MSTERHPKYPYKRGDRVQYYAIGAPSEGTETSITTGIIVDILTAPKPVGTTGVVVKASPEEPRYVIRNDHTGKETAYKVENIIGKFEEEE